MTGTELTLGQLDYKNDILNMIANPMSSGVDNIRRVENSGLWENPMSNLGVHATNAVNMLPYILTRGMLPGLLFNNAIEPNPGSPFTSKTHELAANLTRSQEMPNLVDLVDTSGLDSTIVDKVRGGLSAIDHNTAYRFGDGSARAYGAPMVGMDAMARRGERVNAYTDTIAKIRTPVKIPEGGVTANATTKDGTSIAMLLSLAALVGGGALALV